MKTIDVAAATTKELVEFYNEHSGNAVIKKFADRATAEKRVTSLLAALTWEDDNVRPVVHAPRAVAPVVEENLDALTDEEFEEKVKADLSSTSERKSNAEGIAKSWKDPEVFNARLKRDGVLVEWQGKSEEFKSVRAAFLALGLPDSKHIRFRMKLKEAKVAVFPWVNVDYTFKII